MIRELSENEADFLKRKYEVAVPFELSLEGEELSVNVYPVMRSTAEEFLTLFGKSKDTLFSHESVSWICSRTGTFLEAHGFSLSPDCEDYYINYALPPQDKCETKSVCRLTGGESYTDLTDTDIKGLLGGGYIIYAAVIDGKIVAVANTGVPITDDTPQKVEIGVDTAKKYRRMGYGRSCVAALVNELNHFGHTAIYECASGNLASIALAKGMGGVEISKKIYIVGFQD